MQLAVERIADVDAPLLQTTKNVQVDQYFKRILQQFRSTSVTEFQRL